MLFRSRAAELSALAQAETYLADKLEFESLARSYLRLAEQEIGRLDSIAQQALGFVRETTAPEQLNPAKLIDEVLQLYMRKLQQNHITIEKHTQDDL